MSIRNAVPTDVPAMLEIYAYFVRETAVSFEYEVPTQEEFARRLAEHTVQFPWFVWEENGEVLGYAYAGRPFERAAYHWCAEISCYLAAQVRGRGVGRKLYARIEELLRKQGYREVYAIVTSANEPSMAFHKALGYRPFAEFPTVGYKKGAWYGVTWLEKNLQPLGTPEDFPVSWRNVE